MKGPARSSRAPGGARALAPPSLCAVFFALFFLVPVPAAASAALDPAARPAPAPLTISEDAPGPSPLPEHVVAAREFFLRARDADRRGAVDEALAWYGRAFRRDAESRDLCFLYLDRLKVAGAVDSAVAVAAACEALARASDTTRFSNAGDTARVPSAATASDPLTLAEHKALGEVALRAEDAPAALAHYQAAHRLDEEDGDVLYVLAGLYEDVGDWDGHAEAVRGLLPRLGYPPRLMERLARVYARLDRGEEFVPVLVEAWERTRAPLFGRTLAAHYEAAGLPLSLLETARALSDLAAVNAAAASSSDRTRLEETRAQSLEADALLARAFLLADRPDSALMVTRSLLEPKRGAGGDAGLRFLHASLLFEQGRVEEARPFAASLTHEFPDIAAYHLLEGSILLELRPRSAAGRAAARGALEAALALSPLSPESRARRAYAEYLFASRAAKKSGAGLCDSAALHRAVDSLLTIAGDAGARDEDAPRDTGARAPEAAGEEAGARVPEVADEEAEEGEAGRERAAPGSRAGLADPELEERRLLLEGLAHGRLAQELAPREAGQRPALLTDSVAARRHRRLALERYEAILARDSGQRAALFEAGLQYERLGDLERAKPLFRRLLARDTRHAMAMNYLAYTIIEQGEQGSVSPAQRREEMREADSLLARALALEPENGAYRDSKGWWHFRQGEYDSALTWLEAAREAVPGDPAILDHLVQTLYALGRRAEACAMLRRLHAIDPRHGLTLHCSEAARPAGAGKGAP